jgi:hypothetical protein
LTAFALTVTGIPVDGFTGIPVNPFTEIPVILVTGIPVEAQMEQP